MLEFDEEENQRASTGLPDPDGRDLIGLPVGVHPLRGPCNAIFLHADAIRCFDVSNVAVHSTLDHMFVDRLHAESAWI